MSALHQQFLDKSLSKAFDLAHRKTLTYNISKYDEAVKKGKQQYINLELAKQRASVLKHRVISDLDTYLTDFEAVFTKNGGKVIWALDKEEALKEILQLCKKYDAKKVVKMKSMITEELELNQFLEHHKIESIETDLGEYIVQISNDKPYHIVTPIMHRSKEDVAQIFNEKFGTPLSYTPDDVTAFVREKLREKFVRADVGITGANFLVADVGGVALTENEGNGLMTFSFPKIHIAIAGIEKIIPSMKNLDLFWPLLSTHGTGQKVTVYNSLVTGPKKDDEMDGPEEMYVIILDNGRTNVLAKEHQRRALSCIKCGACLNGCPVYKNIGGHTYNTVYTGPIGSVLTPHLRGISEYKHLSHASSLCGKCTEVCPVKIDLHKQLLHNRHDFVLENHSPFMEKMVMFAWKKIMLNRWMLDFFGAVPKNIFFTLFLKKPWGSRRNLPVVKKQTFTQYWKETRGQK